MGVKNPRGHGRGQFKLSNMFKSQAERGYDAMKRLPSDQYGDTRDKINQQQVKRKVRQDNTVDKGKVAGLLAAIGIFIAGIGVGWALQMVINAVGALAGWSVDILHYKMFWFGLIVLSIIVGLIVMDTVGRQHKASQAFEADDFINDYAGDARIQFVPEMIEKFPVVPNAGAHTSVSASTLISHLMVSNKGVPKVRVPKRFSEDTEIDGEVYYKTEIMEDDDGNPIYEEVPMIDQEFGEFIYDEANIPKGHRERVFRKASEIVIDLASAKQDDQAQGFASLLDMMKYDWEIPDYETARPSGVYLVDTAPVNTLVLAITRGGKGQTTIEPTLDVWTREKRPWNIICNDPKGELLRKFYVPATKRGYEIVQFNLINSMKTDIFNPLGYAVEAAREGKQNKVAEYLTNLSEIFFPKDGGEDKVWPESAAAAFERSCLGLIDYYLEEEYDIRRQTIKSGRNIHSLDARIDNMWGQVTLYNCFEFFLTLVSKKETDPDKVWVNEDDRPAMVFDEENNIEVVDPATPPADKALLDLFFDATAEFPTNDVRSLIDSSNNTLKTMMQSEKMLSSVYGIATSGMRFFSDPTIIDLTSGTSSQNFDIESLSFPRRLSLRFASEWMEKYRYAGMTAKFSAYREADFKEELDPKLFRHSQTIDKIGWVYYAFDGKFTDNLTGKLDNAKKSIRGGYVKLEIFNPDNKMLVKTFYFRVELQQLMKLDGKTYKKNPITGEKVIRNGKVIELQVKRDASGDIIDVTDKDTRIKKTVKDFGNYTKGLKIKEQVVDVPVISDMKLRYTEKPKMVFFITPPHLIV